jgi:hypothetical protein
MMRRILIAFAVCIVLASGSALACINDSETEGRERDYAEQYMPQLVDGRETRQIVLTLLDKRIVVLAGVGGVMLATGVFFALRRREDRSMQ